MSDHKIDFTKYSSPSKKINETVRTTFNVSIESYASMLSLCENFNLKQKQLIDEVVVPTAQAFFKDIDSKDLEKLSNSGDLQRRTFTLSKNSLNDLNKLSKDKGVQRDILFQIGISVQKSILEDMRRKHREAAKLIEKLSTKCEATEKELSHLDEDDPIKNRLSLIYIRIMNLLTEIEEEQSNGTPIKYED